MTTEPVGSEERVESGRVWFCKIGAGHPFPSPADPPMRKAISDTYEELTGQRPDFIFSGWGAELDETERAVVEDRLPDLDAQIAAAQDHLAMLLDAEDPGA